MTDVSVSVLPHFNPDHDGDDPPLQVKIFREMIDAVDIVLICTPEYAYGVPGSLKNAIDWTVSSGNFTNKPVGLITASTAGYKAHRSLIDIMQVLKAVIPGHAALHIPFAKTKVSDIETQAMISVLIEKLSSI